MTTEIRPFLPSGWPMDKRSKMTQWKGSWILAHPERAPMLYIDGKWEEIKPTEQQKQGIAQ